MRQPVCAFFIKTTVWQEGRKLFVVVSDDNLEFHFRLVAVAAPDGRDLALCKKTVFFNHSKIVFSITFSFICIVFLNCFFQSFASMKNNQNGGKKALFFSV